jgi:hypothetical protein
METIKNELELCTRMNSYLDEYGKLNHEEFLNNHDEVSFFDECENIPKGFESYTVFCRANKNGRGLFYFLKSKFEDFQKPKELFETIAEFSENGKLDIKKLLEHDKKLSYLKYREEFQADLYGDIENFIFIETHPYKNEVGLFMLTYHGNFTPKE